MDIDGLSPLDVIYLFGEYTSGRVVYHGKLMLCDFVTALSGLTVLLSVSLLFVPLFNQKTRKDSIAGFRCAAGTQWQVCTETLFSSLVPRD